MIQHIDAALIAGCYMAIIALYVWTFKNVQELKDMLHKHQTEATKHVNSDELVFRDVCSLQVKRFDEKIQGVKDDLRQVKDQINTGFKELKELIREQH